MLVMCMVVVGGLTRLTESGLSIVDWKPIDGTFPPLNVEQWQVEFESYQQSPQYKLVNRGMTVNEFKGIFWLEYIHRLLGRVVGIAFFIPFLLFLAKRMIPREFGFKMAAIFLLGGAQGLLGWYMVKSGLINEPMVSPLRLAAHLTLACLLFSLLWWQWLRLYFAAAFTSHVKTVPLFIALVFIQIILGALVAGMDAGLAYDSFPKMNGEWMPAETWQLSPWWINLVQNPTTAQFIHRCGAVVLVLSLLVLTVKYYKTPHCLSRKALYSLFGILAVQIVLGVLTIIYHVPITIAVAHQFTALLLLAAAVALLYSETHAIVPRNEI